MKIGTRYAYVAVENGLRRVYSRKLDSIDDGMAVFPANGLVTGRVPVDDVLEPVKRTLTVPPGDYDQIHLIELGVERMECSDVITEHFSCVRNSKLKHLVCPDTMVKRSTKPTSGRLNIQECGALETCVAPKEVQGDCVLLIPPRARITWPRRVHGGMVVYAVYAAQALRLLTITQCANLRIAMGTSYTALPGKPGETLFRVKLGLIQEGFTAYAKL